MRLRNIPFGRAVFGFFVPHRKSSGASVCKAVYVLHFDRKLTFQCYKTYIIKGRMAMMGCPWVYIVKGRLAMTESSWGYRQKE